MIRNTQAYQSQLVATAAESYRRQRYQPVTALFHFMFVETGPPSTGAWWTICVSLKPVFTR